LRKTSFPLYAKAKKYFSVLMVPARMNFTMVGRQLGAFVSKLGMASNHRAGSRFAAIACTIDNLFCNGAWYDIKVE